LIRKPFLGSALFEHLEIGGREAEVDARILAASSARLSGLAL